MMRAVIEESPNSCVKTSLKVKQIKNRIAKDRPELYFGTQQGQPTVIHDLSEPGVQHGRPSYYCVTESEEFYKNCRKSFELDWDDPKISITVTNEEIFGVGSPATTLGGR